MWLKYTIVDRPHVDSLTCSICTRFKSKLEGMHNFNPTFIEGSKNVVLRITLLAVLRAMSVLKK